MTDCTRLHINDVGNVVASNEVAYLVVGRLEPLPLLGTVSPTEVKFEVTTECYQLKP